MRKYNIEEEMAQCEESAPKRNKFQGFSKSFLLAMLAVVVGLYVVCTLMVAK